jgi:pimeloyl-ACP methyl ester carboxylesterase
MPGRHELVRDDGRTVVFDEVGDPGGRPVVFLHGTPDSRLARHPDDRLAGDAGVRLLALDRPGYGGTSPVRQDDRGVVHAVDAVHAIAGDLAAVLDDRQVETAAVLAWSGGALAGLAAATAPALAGRIGVLHLVAGVVPRAAHDEPEVRGAVGPGGSLVEMADAMAPRELAEAVAPLMAPRPCDHQLALEHQREVRTTGDQAALAQVDGALDQLADALVEAVRLGLDGVEADIEAQVVPFPVPLREVRVPVHLWYGSADTVTPPAFGDWYARQLPDAALHVVAGAGHYLPFTHWSLLLGTLTG